MAHLPGQPSKPFLSDFAACEFVCEFQFLAERPVSGAVGVEEARVQDSSDECVPCANSTKWGSNFLKVKLGPFSDVCAASTKKKKKTKRNYL